MDGKREREAKKKREKTGREIPCEKLLNIKGVGIPNILYHGGILIMTTTTMLFYKYACSATTVNETIKSKNWSEK